MSYSSNNSVARVIQHQCVGTPTYLDVLPGDVLRFCIIPFLEWEDRIHVNMLTPPGDRTPPNKIPMERIIANQLLINTKKLMPQITRVNKMQELRAQLRRGARKPRGAPTKTRLIEETISVLQSLLERNNILLIQYSNSFRDMLEQKIVEFSEAAAIRAIPRLYLREKLRIVIQQLIELLISHPFIKFIKSKRYLSAEVWQNETDLYYSSQNMGEPRIRRVQGDIYCEME
jgi:hypothetical protein